MMTPATEKAAPIPAEVQPTDAMIEAAAKAIHDHWQNGPGPHARTWEKCCRDFPGAADDFRAKARVGLVAAIMQDRADRQEERIREDEREALALTDGELPALSHPALDGAFSAIQMRWYARTAVMADRARQRGDAS